MPKTSLINGNANLLIYFTHNPHTTQKEEYWSMHNSRRAQYQPGEFVGGCVRKPLRTAVFVVGCTAQAV
jgi:hypothetical protein